MKKGRSGVEVTVLAAPADADRLAETLMAQTGSLGVRRAFADRYVAERESVALQTTLGAARFKIGRVGETRHVRAEADDVEVDEDVVEADYEIVEEPE